MNIYIVKSGQLIDFVGWEWLNLRAFPSYDTARQYADEVEKQIKNLDVEGVEVEQLTLEGVLI